MQNFLFFCLSIRMSFYLCGRTLATALSLVSLLALSACATKSHNDYQDPDPWEGMNRGVFAFNSKLDSWVLRPVAKGYDFIAPAPVQQGVGNFFGNLGEIGNISNDVLQWKWRQAGNDSARFVVNSTLGLLGLLDVATPMGLEPNEGEDFGQTLAHWGVARGPYVVLPFLGPSTVRDGLALPVDFYVMDPVSYAERQAVVNTAVATRIVHRRAELFDIEELASGDMYVFMRDAYLQRRDYLEGDGELAEDYEDEFGDEDF
ncbi:MlaA family lipoprotein [Agaribacterium haliotis]|uniref:MlaA family lipoprotein n=1 Tax=Agaribacterium haliotis TaxID=2013869 RepID=UPI001EFDF891|nr:VacJ family lipoprotein [Agaribacterium haliotis]